MTEFGQVHAIPLNLFRLSLRNILFLRANIFFMPLFLTEEAQTDDIPGAARSSTPLTGVYCAQPP